MGVCGCRIGAMARLVRLRLPAATVIMLGVFPRHWGGEFNGRQYAEDAWPNPLAKVPLSSHPVGIP